VVNFIINYLKGIMHLGHIFGVYVCGIFLLLAFIVSFECDWASNKFSFELTNRMNSDK